MHICSSSLQADCKLTLEPGCQVVRLSNLKWWNHVKLILARVQCGRPSRRQTVQCRCAWWGCLRSWAGKTWLKWKGRSSEILKFHDRKGVQLRVFEGLGGVAQHWIVWFCVNPCRAGSIRVWEGTALADSLWGYTARACTHTYTRTQITSLGLVWTLGSGAFLTSLVWRNMYRHLFRSESWVDEPHWSRPLHFWFQDIPWMCEPTVWPNSDKIFR